mgnify:FL=1
MELIREKVNNPIIAGAVGLAIGLFIGWFVIGWGIWPVTWTDASPADLQQTYRDDYLRMVVDSYALIPNADDAQARWAYLGADAEQTLANVIANPGAYPENVENFRQIVGSGAVSAADVPLPEGMVAEPDTGEQASGGTNYTLILVMCGLVSLLAAAVAGYLFIFRQRAASSSTPEFMSPIAQAQEISRNSEPTDFSARGEVPPMSQFMTTYMLGDDLFDDSFSLDSPTGEFLGECGVGISESIGVGEPKKVAAYEIWLFDKNDIQTVTKVLMSRHAYGDATLRERLQTKGEPFPSEPGAEMILETATLRLVARVVDMAYGSGGSVSPQGSYFDRLTLELAVWQKI